MKNILVLLLAGSSKRFNNKIKKQFIKINNKPLFCISLDVFLKTKKFNNVVLVIDKNDELSQSIKYLKMQYKKYFDNKVFHIVYGGVERYNSVYNSLCYINENFIDDKNNNINILIHDSSRPYIENDDIIKILTALKKYKSVSLSSPVINTIKFINKNKSSVVVNKTLNRNLLYEVYTPQGFKFVTLFKAYIKFMSKKNNVNITDDLQIIELFSNEKSYLIEGSRNNKKITYKSDLNINKMK